MAQLKSQQGLRIRPIIKRIQHVFLMRITSGSRASGISPVPPARHAGPLRCHCRQQLIQRINVRTQNLLNPICYYPPEGFRIFLGSYAKNAPSSESYCASKVDIKWEKSAMNHKSFVSQLFPSANWCIQNGGPQQIKKSTLLLSSFIHSICRGR